MGNLTKRDLVIRISNETGMTQEKVMSVIQRMLDQIVESLSNGQEIELRDFGAFRLKARKARVGRNPKKADHDVPIPARVVARFRSSQALEAKVMALAQPINRRVTETSLNSQA